MASISPATYWRPVQDIPCFSSFESDPELDKWKMDGWKLLLNLIYPNCKPE